MRKPATTKSPIHELMKSRWSPRAFDAGKPVDREKLMSLLEAARWAPSCFNEQPWRFLLFDGSNQEALEKARSVLMEGNSWAKAAPALILTVACESFTRNNKPNRHAQYDTGLATENLVLQAEALGLATHQMAGFDSAKARELFGIPEGHTPMAMIAIGYPGEMSALSPELQEREKSERTRREIKDFCFAGHWSRPVES